MPAASEALRSSHRKLARAKDHIQDLRRRIEAFEQSCPYSSVSGTDSDFPNEVVHKIKITMQLPESVCEIAGDAANNLREALDHAGYSVAVASGKINPRNCQFPFARTEEDLRKSSIGNAKDVPEEIRSLFCAFQPFKGGDDLLWSLNNICVCNKHKILAPFGVVFARDKAAHINVTQSCSIHSRNSMYIKRPPLTWDLAKQEIIIAITPIGTKVELNYDFALTVAFAT